MRYALSILTRSLLAGFGFWLVHPLWLACVWYLQGYPVSLNDLMRWYVLGAFNIAPIVSASLAGFLWSLGALWLGKRFAPRRLRWMGVLFVMLLVPPIAYGILLWYAGVLPYTDICVALPILLRAYFYLGGTSFAVGWIVGATPPIIRYNR